MEKVKQMKKAIILLPIALLILLPSIALASPPNNTGLTAKVIAAKGQVITGTINAAGFDIGVYVGPGITGVVIANAKIFGANDHGIFVQDTRGIVIKDNNITGNGVSPHVGLPEDKAIILSGTTNCLVKDNFVGFNGIGGISVTDDGPVSPGSLNPGSPGPGQGNVIAGNVVENNIGDCGIVISAFNPGEGVSDNVVTGNTVIGNSFGPTNPPFIGGIVVAADAPSTTAEDNSVLGNTVIGGWIPGIIVHSNAPSDLVTGTVIALNRLISNGAGPDPTDAPNTAGIVIANEALGGGAVLTHTLVVWNTVTNDYYGMWHMGDTNTKIIFLLGNAVVKVGNP
jgi:hypothetical protein